MTPGAGFLVLGRDHISHIVKMHYFFKILLLYSKALIRQTKYIVMMTKVGSSKFHICHYCEYVLSSSLSIYFTLIAFVLKDCDAAFLYHC